MKLTGTLSTININIEHLNKSKQLTQRYEAIYELMYKKVGES